MACESFEDCQIVNPLEELGVGDRFDSLGKILAAVVNFIRYAFYAYFLIMIIWSLAHAIFALISDSGNQNTMKIFQKGLIDAAKYTLGLVLVVSANFFLVWILNLVGLTDAASYFETFDFLGS